MTITNIDQAAFKGAVGSFPTGLIVVTGVCDGSAVGMTLQSFMSLSLDPMLVAVAVARTSTTWPRIEPAGSFAANVMSKDHADVVRRFASAGERRFDGDEVETTAAGNPVFSRAVTWLDCRIDRVVDGGDHQIVIAEVVEIKPPRPSTAPEALIYYRSRFHHLVPQPH